MPKRAPIFWVKNPAGTGGKDSIARTFTEAQETVCEILRRRGKRYPRGLHIIETDAAQRRYEKVRATVTLRDGRCVIKQR